MAESEARIPSAPGRDPFPSEGHGTLRTRKWIGCRIRESLDDLYFILGFLVPGMITLFVRSQFVTGRNPPHTAALLSYLPVSVVYYALALPFVDAVLSISEPGYAKALSWFALVFAGPIKFLGVLLGLERPGRGCFGADAQDGAIFYPVHVHADCLGLEIWQYEGAVGSRDPEGRGAGFAGFCGEDCFMSSDPSESAISTFSGPTTSMKTTSGPRAATPAFSSPPVRLER